MFADSKRKRPSENSEDDDDDDDIPLAQMRLCK